MSQTTYGIMMVVNSVLCLRKSIGRGKWLSAQEAIDFGFFDKMLPNYQFDIETEGLNNTDTNCEHNNKNDELLKLAMVGATVIEAEKQKIPISVTRIYNTINIWENN